MALPAALKARMFSLRLVSLSASWPFKLLLTDRKHFVFPLFSFMEGLL